MNFYKIMEKLVSPGMAVMLLTASCDMVPPSVPENLQVYPDSHRSMVVTWDFDIYGEDLVEDFEFKIYRDNYYVGETWAAFYYVDFGLEPATEYCYRVSSEYTPPFSGGEGPRSSEVCSETYPLSTLSGIVTVDGSAMQGVRIDLFSVYPDRGTYSVLTDHRGYYLVTGLENGSYVITPSITGYTFTPESLSVNILNGDAIFIDFTAAVLN